MVFKTDGSAKSQASNKMAWFEKKKKEGSRLWINLTEKSSSK